MPPPPRSGRPKGESRKPAGTVTVIATATNTVTTTLPAGNLPNGIGTTPDGASVWVADRDGVISVIDTATNTISETFTLPGVGRISSFAFTPDGSFAYAASGTGIDRWWAGG